MSKKGPPTMVIVNQPSSLPELPDLSDLTTEDFNFPSSSKSNQSPLFMQIFKEPSSIDEALKNLLDHSEGNVKHDVSSMNTEKFYHYFKSNDV